MYSWDIIVKVREGFGYQIGWIFGKLPKGWWSLSRLTCWRQLVVRTFARGLEATTCPLNMKKANMFPISPDTWSIRVHYNLFKSLVFKIPQSYIVGALEILFENKQNLEHRPNNAGVPAYCLWVAAYGQEISLRHSNYVALPHFRNRMQWFHQGKKRQIPVRSKWLEHPTQL